MNGQVHGVEVLPPPPDQPAPMPPQVRETNTHPHPPPPPPLPHLSCRHVNTSTNTLSLSSSPPPWRMRKRTQHSIGHLFVRSRSQDIKDLRQRSLVAQGVAAFSAAVAHKMENNVPRPPSSPTKVIHGERYGEVSSPDLMEAYINRDVVRRYYRQ